MRDMRFFQGVQYVPGVGWLEPGHTGATGPVHGEADIAMVSGLGSQVALPARSGGATATQTSALTRSDAQSVVRSSGFFVSTIPWWGWFLAGLAAAGVLMWLKTKTEEKRT